jgi:DNA-binding SARP family transcriptional activator
LALTSPKTIAYPTINDFRQLEAADWKSSKALAAFKYLAANREKGSIPRDVLMELLWPGVPRDSAAKSLNTALTSLRKTLEPQVARGVSSHLVIQGDSLGLELGPGGGVDLEPTRSLHLRRPPNSKRGCGEA